MCVHWLLCRELLTGLHNNANTVDPNPPYVCACAREPKKVGGAHLVCVKWNKLQPSCAYKKMRNLEVTRYVSLPPSPLLAGASGGRCLSVDGEEGVWVATAAALCRVTSDLAVQWSPCGNWSFQHCITQVSVEVPLVEVGHVTSEDYIIGVECVSESVCLATRNGDILLYNIQTRDVCVFYIGTPL